VAARPPAARVFSRTMTGTPVCPRSAAAVNPAMPPPITTIGALEWDVIPASRLTPVKGYKAALRLWATTITQTSRLRLLSRGLVKEPSTLAISFYPALDARVVRNL
jgi:hypothetical protein